MPRGVKGSGPLAAKSKGKAKPKPAVKPVGKPVAARVAPPAESVRHDGPLKSVDIASLTGQALKDYATRLGLPKRDVENLTEDRLRQNAVMFVHNHIELLTEA